MDIPSLARSVIHDIGYDDPALGFASQPSAVLTSIDEQSGDIAMVHNHPNPFEPSTVFMLQTESAVIDARIEIFGVDGRLIREIPVGSISAGRSNVSWQGTDHNGVALPGGVYFYRLMYEGGHSGAGKAVLLR